MAEPTNISAHYVKSPSFDEHPLHGIYGGVTTAGVISMALYSERMPIPTRMDLEIKPVEGAAGIFEPSGEAVHGKEGIVRFVHGVYYLDVQMAKAMIGWLVDKVNAFEEMRVAD